MQAQRLNEAFAASAAKGGVEPSSVSEQRSYSPGAEARGEAERTAYQDQVRQQRRELSHQPRVNELLLSFRQEVR